jgi:hypothetical protein
MLTVGLTTLLPTHHFMSVKLDFVFIQSPQISSAEMNSHLEQAN